MFRYLGYVGYITDGTGGSHILVESGALASHGSLSGLSLLNTTKDVEGCTSYWHQL